MENNLPFSKMERASLKISSVHDSVASRYALCVAIPLATSCSNESNAHVSYSVIVIPCLLTGLHLLPFIMRGKFRDVVFFKKSHSGHLSRYDGLVRFFGIGLGSSAHLFTMFSELVKPCQFSQVFQFFSTSSESCRLFWAQ